MKDLEKAREIQRETGTMEDAALMMAEWKDQQFAEERKQWIEKACEWLKPVFKDLTGYNCGSDLIEDFKKAMEE